MSPIAMKGMLAFLALMGCLIKFVAAASRQMQFRVSDGGLIESVEEPLLHLNVKGGGQNGDPLVLYPFGAHEHEHFTVSAAEGRIRLTADPRLCLQAEGGSSGKIIVWPCAEDTDEDFIFDAGLIKMNKHRNMCITVDDNAISVGGELFLRRCHRNAAEYENFAVDNGFIRLMSSPLLHFSIKGGGIESGAEVVLWDDQPLPHEVFKFYGDAIAMPLLPHKCINAEGGLKPGARVIIYHCSMGWTGEAPTANEQWKYDPVRKIIHSVVQPNLAFNIEGGPLGVLEAGSGIVLWPLGEEEL